MPNGDEAMNPSIDLGFGALPLYGFIFIFSFFGVLFLRRFVRDHTFRKHLVPLCIAGTALVAGIVYAIATSNFHLFGKTFTWSLLLIFLAISFLLQIFRRSFGTLLALCFGLLILAVFLFIRSLTAFTGRTLIANIHIQAADGKEMRLLIEPKNDSLPGQEAFTVTLPGERFGLIVYQVIFSDLAVFVGAKTQYAWIGMTSFGRDFEQKAVNLFPDTLSRRSIFESLEHRELTLPFVRSVQADIPTKIALPRMSYAVWIENDGGVTITSGAR
jgi:hypothetical protein